MLVIHLQKVKINLIKVSLNKKIKQKNKKKKKKKKKNKKKKLEMDNSIYKEINEFLEQKNNINCVPDILRTKLSINFENNYSTVIDNVYYNRISTDKISMFEEEKSGAKFFLIPHSVLLNLCSFFYILLHYSGIFFSLF